MHTETIFFFWLLITVALGAMAAAVWTLALAHRRFVAMHDVWLELHLDEHYRKDEHSSPLLAITIHNRSLLPVTIANVDVAAKVEFGPDMMAQRLLYPLLPHPHESRQLPCRMARRSRVTLLCPLDHADFRRKVNFFSLRVTTACGETVLASDDEAMRVVREIVAGHNGAQSGANG